MDDNGLPCLDLLEATPPYGVCPAVSIRASAAQFHHFMPCLGASPQRTDPGNAMGLEEQCRTGAGSFVWSTAVQNNFPVTRNPLDIAFVLDGETDRPGYRGQIVIQRGAQIDNEKVLA